MSRVRRIPDRHRRAAARLAGGVGRVVGFALAVELLGAVAGPLTAAGAAAGYLTIAGLRWWARVEARVFSPRPKTELLHREAAVVDDRHLAFAQALAAVATRYLAECEAEDLS
jgi:hypothetical protein